MDKGGNSPSRYSSAAWNIILGTSSPESIQRRATKMVRDQLLRQVLDLLSLAQGWDVTAGYRYLKCVNPPGGKQVSWGGTEQV